MALNLTRLVQSALGIAFRLGSGLVKEAVYHCPVSFAPATGLTGAAEVRATVQALCANYRTTDLGLVTVEPGNEKVLVRASELLAIAAPGAGDYLVESGSGLRREVLSARLDPTGLFWILHAMRSLHLDWGDLSPFTTAEDWGDLAPATESEDYLSLP